MKIKTQNKFRLVRTIGITDNTIIEPEHESKHLLLLEVDHHAEKNGEGKKRIKDKLIVY